MIFLIANTFFGLSFLVIACRFANYWDAKRIQMHAVFDIMEAKSKMKPVSIHWDGTASNFDWYTITTPGKRTSFIVPKNSNKALVWRKARWMIKQYDRN